MLMLFRLVIVFSAFIAATIPAAAEDLVLSGGAKWLVIASSASLSEVEGVVEDYHGIADRRIVRARNGRFALVAGPFTNYPLEAAKNSGLVRPDAYLSTGSILLETVSKVEGKKSTVVENTVVQNDLAREIVEVAARSNSCKAIEANLARLTCYDRAVGRPVTANPDVSEQASTKVHPAVVEVTEPIVVATPQVSPRDAIVPTSLTLKAQRQDFESDVMSDRIEMRVAFRNGWGKGVVGISHRFQILNAFGEVIHKGRDNLDIQIPAGETRESNMFYYWDDNPFISQEVYDRLLGSVSNGTYKIEMTVEKVILSGGEVLEVSGSS